MSRMFGLVGFVLALWVAMELYTNGLTGAFGGVLAEDPAASSAALRTERAVDAFQRGYDESIERVDRQLE